MMYWFGKQRKTEEQAEPQLDSDCHRIKCDCCGTETLAQVRGNKLVIMDKRHGRKHIAVLSLSEILKLMRAFDPQSFETTDEVLVTD